MMRDLLFVLKTILAGNGRALLQGAALGLAVLLAGFALLGISGWFVTAAAAAGLAGSGAVFDVFRPSALIRLSALGRSVARYGERLMTHDATLRAVASLRVDVLSKLGKASHDRLIMMRSTRLLNRITADIDVLDNVPLRIVLPIASGLVSLVVAFLILWLLVDIRIAICVPALMAIGGAIVFWRGLKAARTPSRRSEFAMQAFRSRLLELTRARNDLLVLGRLPRQRQTVADADQRRSEAHRMLDRRERNAGAALSLIGAVAATAALSTGAWLVNEGLFSPATAAIGFFAALALLETIHPLRRAIAELGRTQQSARRLRQELTAPGEAMGTKVVDHASRLTLEDISFQRSGRPIVSDFGLTLEERETVAITGPSGRGKSTVLLMAGGLLEPTCGRIMLNGTSLSSLAEHCRNKHVTLLSQRSTLMSGTVADNLRLAAPDTPDDVLQAALEAVRLTEVLAPRGGLSAVLGPSGRGLSGGESRRLALARTLLRRPAFLLLDEPTEGLNDEMAKLVLLGVRRFLPDCGILIAAHRHAEIAVSDRLVAVT